jgi:hypothetical protein
VYSCESTLEEAASQVAKQARGTSAVLVLVGFSLSLHISTLRTSRTLLLSRVFPFHYNCSYCIFSSYRFNTSQSSSKS